MKKILSVLAIAVFVGCSVISLAPNTYAARVRCSASPLYEADYYEGCMVTLGESTSFYTEDQVDLDWCNDYCRIIIDQGMRPKMSWYNE